MMEKNKDILIVIIATLIFGGVSKILVGVPYMAWGYFDQLFIAAFILWTFYSAVLYVAIKIENKNENYLKNGFVGLMFSLAVACLKMGVDAIIEQFARSASNLIITAFMMEMGILILGSIIIFALYIYVAKKEILWNKTMKNYALGLGGILSIYFAVIVYYLLQLKHWMEKFSGLDRVKEIGKEQGILNLSTKYARESTMLGMVVYVVFFIVLWIALKKNTEYKES